MIQTVFYTTRDDGVNLFRTFSDLGMMIRQVETGAEYSEAIDVEGAYTYVETETPIDEEPVTAEEALDILLGEASE